MIQHVVKRNGDVVQFSAQKIADAIDRCYSAAGDVAPQQAASMVVQLLRGRFGGDAPTVEQVQNAVESVLLSLGERDAAKRYMAYRDERANARRMSAVTPHLRSVYEAGAASMGGEPLRVFQYFDKYARHRDDLEGGPRRETWPECVDRSMDHLRWLVVRECGEDKITPAEWAELRSSIVACESMPSMRLLSQAGAAARRDDISIMNCSYQAITDLLCFRESLLISMAGCGDAYSVEQKFITNLPFVRHQRGGKPETYIIDDSSEGWANALLHGIERWYDGADVVFDYSELRLAGAILKTKGGRSSGPGPLRKVLNGVRALILSRQGSQLRPVDVNDLLCLTGEAGNSGGQRRTAKLSLSDWNDSDMQAAKSAHGWWDTHPHRSNANNSAVWPEGGPSQLELMGQMHSMFLGASGERGIFSRENALRTMPKRREEYLRSNGGAENLGTNPCLTGGTMVALADGRGNVPIAKLAEEGNDVPVFCLKGNNVVVRMMRNPRLTGHKVPILKVSLDDGSSIRVTENHKFLNTDGKYIEAKDLAEGASLATMNRKYASIKEMFPKSNSRSQKYIWIRWEGRAVVYAEHRLIAAFHQNIDGIPRGSVVHHIDYNAQNNAPSNLRIMARKDHDDLHRAGKMGDENPMRRAAKEWSTEKWDAYKEKHRKNSHGASNANFSGVSNEDLKRHALILTKRLNKRFSGVDWMAYADSNGIPQGFSKWRKDHLGSMSGLAKWAAMECGIEHADLDQRTAKRLLSMLESGYDCEVVDNRIVFKKLCEECGTSFSTHQRESGLCSGSCVMKYNYKNHGHKMRATAAQTFAARKESLRKSQVKVYLDLKARIPDPQKKEWAEACKNAGVSAEMCRDSSPFRAWKDLKQSACDTNHRVVSVEPDGFEDVYNGTVDEVHNFFVGAFPTKDGFAYLNNRQCGEIYLQSRSFCNLTQAVARPSDTLDTLRRKVRAATILGTVQSLATNYPHLRSDWGQHGREERLLGVDITGQMDCELLRRGDIEAEATLVQLRAYARSINETYAVRLGISASMAITCNKPSGNSSALLDCAPGINARKIRYGIRNARVSASSPVYQVLKACGVPMDPENGQNADTATTWVVHFPMCAPEGSIVESERSAVQQLDHWMLNKRHWTEHNPSVTATYSPDEMIDVISWVWKHREEIGGISFLPRSNSVYRQMPYEETSKAEYEAALATFPAIDWAMIAAYEREDTTTSSRELACGANGCETT